MGQTCAADCGQKGRTDEEFDAVNGVVYSTQGDDVKRVGPSSCFSKQRLNSDAEQALGSEAYPEPDETEGMMKLVAAETIEKVPAEGVEWKEVFSRLYIPPGQDRIRDPIDTTRQETGQGRSTINGRPVENAETDEEYDENDWPKNTPDVNVKDECEAETREYVLQGIFSGRPLYSVPRHLRSDKDIVLAAIRMEGAFCSDYIEPQSMRSVDRDVVLALVRSDGLMLEMATEALRDDFEVVCAAVKTNSGALRSASKRLQADRELKSMAAAQAKEEKRLTKLFADKCAPVKCWGR